MSAPRRKTQTLLLAGAVLLLGLLSCASAAEEQSLSNRKLLQLQQPWLRLPAYETINPFRLTAAVTRQFIDRVSYGFLGDYVGDFFDDSFDFLQASFGDIGTSIGL
ncbi:hypothetical protein HOP50_02g15190 [Chloropicon primus]|uniref:Uncharacterized protein n=1 Tax=Chloropicon primus TaxID=1764295 RepID=A0A5B8MFE1_9CHLO|nr:hypothetical protein A3770_02p15290 [Chloropicon primus]UPQ98219.1 hypothetical protein HOP50_02g15190 [Chloropicon primus]|eukprot:QDZ19011.1 hypothetical protein A3770_02p15290 [Chloropicon primus]